MSSVLLLFLDQNEGFAKRQLRKNRTVCYAILQFSRGQEAHITHYKHLHVLHMHLTHSLYHTANMSKWHYLTCHTCIYVGQYGTVHRKGTDNSTSRITVSGKSTSLSTNFWRLSTDRHSALTGNGYCLAVNGFAPTYMRGYIRWINQSMKMLLPQNNATVTVRYVDKGSARYDGKEFQELLSKIRRKKNATGSLKTSHD